MEPVRDSDMYCLCLSYKRMHGNVDAHAMHAMLAVDVTKHNLVYLCNFLKLQILPRWHHGRL